MKKIKILGLLAMSAVMLTGCVDAMPDMTTEQSDIVAEYAAGLLLKYSPNYNYRLVSDEELAAALAQENTIEEETESEAVTETEETKASSEETAKEQDETQQSTESAAEQIVQDVVDVDADLAVELGIDAEIALRYQSFEICDSYPQNASGFSGTDAKQGKKLLVLHFDLENTSDEVIPCNLYDASLKLRVNINQSVLAGALETPLLPDDLVSFAEDVAAKETKDLAVVFEIDELMDEEIETLTPQMFSADKSVSVIVR